MSGFGPLWPLKLCDLDGDHRGDLVGISGAAPDMTGHGNQGWNATTLIVGSDRKTVVSGPDRPGNHLGDTHRASGDTAAARAVWLEALAMLDELGHADAEGVRAKLATL